MELICFKLVVFQPRPASVPYRAEMSPMSGNQQFNYNKADLPRYLSPQRPNGAILRPRK